MNNSHECQLMQLRLKRSSGSWDFFGTALLWLMAICLIFYLTIHYFGKDMKRRDLMGLGVTVNKDEDLVIPSGVQNFTELVPPGMYAYAIRIDGQKSVFQGSRVDVLITTTAHGKKETRILLSDVLVLSVSQNAGNDNMIFVLALTKAQAGMLAGKGKLDLVLRRPDEEKQPKPPEPNPNRE